MANLLDTLRIGGNALSAQQIAAQVVGTNISSASVGGYHRQTAVFHGMEGLGGVRDVSVERVADQFIEAQVNAQTASYEFANQRSEGLSLIMEAVGSLDDSGLSASMSDFFASWRNLNVTPDDLTIRRDVLVKSQILGERVAEASLNLQSSAKLADDDIVHSLDALNDALATVAHLNQAIGQASALGQPDSALRDQRDLTVANLNKLVGVTTCTEPDGQLTVLMGNVSVVSQDHAFTVVAQTNADTGYHDLLVQGTSQGVMDGRLSGGSIGAKLALRDRDIPQTSGALDQFVYDLASAINTQHAAGYGLDGVGGRNLFDLPATATGAARLIALDATLQQNPEYLAAAATAAGAPGDSANALAIVDLEGAAVCSAGTETPANAVARIVSDAGQAVALSRADRDRVQKQRDQISQLYEEQNGVSLDEQMMQLSRIQNAFQASAKLVGVVERMLETLQNL